MALAVKDIIANCSKFNMNQSASKVEFNKIKEVLILAEFEVLKEKENAFLMSLEREGKAWLVECRITGKYNMFQEWKIDIDSQGYIGLVNLCKQVYGYVKKEKVILPSDDITIEQLDLSVRSYNILKRAGINTVGDIRELPIQRFMALRNLGTRSAHEIYEKIGKDTSILPRIERVY